MRCRHDARREGEPSGTAVPPRGPTRLIGPATGGGAWFAGPTARHRSSRLATGISSAAEMTEAEQAAGQTALAEREEPSLPRLLTPRQVSWRAIGVVLAAELGALGLALLTNSMAGGLGIALAAIVVWS